MYVCTYQQIQDMLSLQCDCSVVTDQEECNPAILYYKEDKNDVCTLSMCIHVQLLTYHWLTIKRGILGGMYSRLLCHCDEQCSCTSQLGAGCLLLFQLVC